MVWVIETKYKQELSGTLWETRNDYWCDKLIRYRIATNFIKIIN
jgi:hypothetical protein